MNQKDKTLQLQKLKELALEDLLETSDEELLSEASELQDNVEDIASNLKKMMREKAAEVVRSQIIKSNNQFALKAPAEAIRPTLHLEVIKKIIQDVFSKSPELKVAFRDGKKQSDNDWMSVWDDLVKLGKINPRDYEL